MKKLFLLLTTYYLLLTTSAFAQNPVIAPEVRIPGKAQNQVRRIQKPMTGVLFYRLSDSTMCVRNPDNSVTPLGGGGSGDYSPWDTTSTAIIEKDTTLSVGIGITAPAGKFHVVDSAMNALFDSTGIYLLYGNDTFFISADGLNAFSNIGAGSGYMATFGDTIVNLKVTRGDTIGEYINYGWAWGLAGSTENGDSVARLRWDGRERNWKFNIQGGNTVLKINADDETVQVPSLAGSAQKLVTALADGTLDTASVASISPWREVNDTIIWTKDASDSVSIYIDGGSTVFQTSSSQIAIQTISGFGERIILPNAGGLQGDVCFWDSSGGQMFFSSLLKIGSVTQTVDFRNGSVIRSIQTTAPTSSLTGTTLNDGGGTGAAFAITSGSTNMAGSFTITAGNGTPGAGKAGKLVFSGTFSAAPKLVLVTSKDADGTENQIYISNAATSGFDVNFNTALSASEVVEFYYFVVQ